MAGGRGNPDAEDGVARPGVDGELATVSLDDDAPRDVEAEAGALADILGREEGLERAGCDLRRHARAAVPDLDDDGVAVDRVVTRSVPEPSIASMALSIRLVQTWLSSPAYASTRGTSAA